MAEANRADQEFLFARMFGTAGQPMTAKARR